LLGGNALRSRSLGLALATIALAGLNPVHPAFAEDAPDLAAAQKQFLNSCGVCHTVEPNAEIRQGPNLRTAFGRAAGTLAEFPNYSPALKKAGSDGLVWNDEALNKWISGAGDFIPGVNMMYSQPDPDKRKLVITYLKSLASSK
jgi:cytochrome c